MGRGIFFGFIWGGLVSVLGLSVASVVGEVPVGAPDAQVESVTEAPVESVQTNAPVAADVPEPAPMGVDQPQAPSADTSPAALPETGVVADAPDAPVVQDGTVDAVTEEEPVLPSPQAMAPEAVEGEDAPDLAAEAPVAEDAPVAEVPAEETPDPAAAAVPEVAEDETTDAAPDVASDAPADPVAPSVEQSADAPSNPAVTDTPTPNLDGQTPPAAPRIALQSEQGGSVGEPVGTFGDQADNVETGRLPSITNDAPEATTQDDEADTVEAAPEPDARTKARNTPAWENPEERPLMSILLIDDGSSPIGDEEQRSFPYPITFAVSATAPDAADMVATYRAEGFEVLALADLPEQATPSDIEVAIEASLGNVPEAAGLLIAGDVPGGRQGTEQIIEKLAMSGHGLVTASTGLNATGQLAESTGFPAANIFDDMDSEGQTPTVIRRFLDNAAFRAAQGEEVIMLGRIRPDTISALLLWGLGDRAGRVALVPVSAVLTAQ